MEEILKHNIDNLIKLVEDKTGHNSVLYIELISLEIKENSFFKIIGKGYNIENYDLDVKSHLRDNKNSSLLLLKHENNSTTRYLYGKLDPLKEVNYYDNNMDYFAHDRKYHKVDELRDLDIIIQWMKWLEMAQKSFPNMQNACFLHSDLTIPFSQNSINIISAVWVFFSEPEIDFISIEKTLQTGIYEYIIYTLLPDKIQQLERQDTFDALAHAQKQYIHALKSISSRLGDDEKPMLEYLYNSLKGFLAVSKSYRERALENIRTHKISLSDVIRNIVKLFEDLILVDIEILDLSIKGNDNRRDNLFIKNKNHTLFTGNYDKVDLEEAEYRMYIPQMLLKEAIVNSIENANSNDPVIKINITLKDTEIIISITNNGMASEDDVKEILNPQNPYKLGCRLIVDLTRILDWKFDAASNYKDQTTYKFIIKK